MASAGPIAPGDTRRELTRQNLHQNLTDMVAHCRAEEVPVVLCTLVSNDTDFEPDSDSRFVDLANDDRGTWDEHLARAHSLLSRADVADRNASQALRHLNQAADIFDGFAFLHFLRGRALAILKEDAQAHVAFVRARDLDTTPYAVACPIGPQRDHSPGGSRGGRASGRCGSLIRAREPASWGRQKLDVRSLTPVALRPGAVGTGNRPAIAGECCA